MEKRLSPAYDGRTESTACRSEACQSTAEAGRVRRRESNYNSNLTIPWLILTSEVECIYSLKNDRQRSAQVQKTHPLRA